MSRIIFLISLLFLAACAKGQGMSLRPYQDKHASPQSFSICHGFSCSYQTKTGFADEDWQKILRGFSPPAKDAHSERLKIADAVRKIEAYVNEHSGLNRDLGKAVSFEKDQDQMDCVDETINTSQYLAFLDRAGVFKFHSAVDPVHRGYFVDGMWPHNSAAVLENEGGAVFVIDSYYYDSGVKIAIVPLDEWLADWHPEDVARD